jgi:hypothetical protein
MQVRQTTFRAKPLFTKEMLTQELASYGWELSRQLRGCAANDEMPQAEKLF